MLSKLLAPSPAPMQPQAQPLPQGGGTGMNNEALMAMMGAVQAPQQHYTPVPQTTFPEAPRALNPQFSQLLMQSMMQGNQGAQTPTLGQLLQRV